ncbi:hypothetical protein D9M70_578440 [compost metagenome]
MSGIVLGGAVGDLDEQPARLLYHQGQGVVRGDQVGVDAEAQKPQAVLEIVLPDGLLPLEQVFSAPDVVDEDIEPPLFTADARDQRCDFGRLEMIDLNGNTLAAEAGDDVGRFLDRFGPFVFGLLLTCGAAGHVDGGAGGAEFHSDAAPAAPCRAGNQSDFSFESHGFPPWGR